MRLWLSGPRILRGLVRPGISLGREDLHPRLPSWRIVSAVIKTGERYGMTRAEAERLADMAIKRRGAWRAIIKMAGLLLVGIVWAAH